MPALNDKQIESLNRHLAEKVMGWKINEWGQWVDKNDKTMCLEEQWNPPENIAQAMGCFKKLKNYTMTLSTDTKIFNCKLSTVRCFVNSEKGEANSYEAAISLVCAKASGWKG